MIKFCVCVDKNLASSADALIKRCLLVMHFLSIYPQPDGDRKSTVVSESLEELNPVRHSRGRLGS